MRPAVPADAATRPAVPLAVPDSPVVSPDPTPLPPAPTPAQTRVILAGGGSLPSLNQVSLAQDLALARASFTGPARVLFASGSAALAQVDAARSEGDPFLASLAELLDARSGRDARYVPAPVRAHEASTAAAVLSAVRDTLDRSPDPLLLYVAAHGAGGESPRDAVVNLWEDSEITVPELSEALDRDPRPSRPVRVVLTACFSGGFAELAFQQADPRRGPARTARCGLFAAPWDRESSGCDPNPDRRAQDGFGLHFLNAIRGQNREGAALPLAALDYDRDGRVSLLDAHTRARIAGRSIDVPTTTSERWLREVEPAPVTRDATRTDPLVQEEDAVIAALSEALAVGPDLAGARAALARVDAERAPLLARLDAIDARDDTLRRALAASVLAEFPALDDPWHPDWSAQLAAARSALAPRLATDPRAVERASLAVERASLSDQLEPLDVRAALALRLWRAHENRALAQRVRARGGVALAHFTRLRSCERSEP
jgi:hypothetical protein